MAFSGNMLLGLVLLVAQLTAAAPQALAPKLNLPIVNAGAPDIIPNRYIVVYNSSFSNSAIDAKMSSFSAAIKKRNLNKRSLEGRQFSTEITPFKMNKWRAMALDADDSMIMDINSAEEVEYVEADHWVKTQATIAQTNAPLGLQRLSESQPGQQSYLFDESAGEGIMVYVVDTGVRTSHVEFQGRATFGKSFVEGAQTDDNGHGSHVAGTIAGATFGVAKKASITAVKVLNAEGSGQNSGILGGLQFVMNDVKQKNLTGRAVMNMSLGGSKSQAMNRAIEAIFKSGIVPVVAAGNENQDSANVSPASSPNAITVGAIDAKNDQRAKFSNFGEAVDIFAPGVNVLSVGIKSDTDTKTLSGTSMASPHIAGLAAYLMRLQNVQDPAQVGELMKNLGSQTGAKVTNNVQGTTPVIANNGHTEAANGGQQGGNNNTGNGAQQGGNNNAGNGAQRGGNNNVGNGAQQGGNNNVGNGVQPGNNIGSGGQTGGNNNVGNGVQPGNNVGSGEQTGGNNNIGNGRTGNRNQQTGNNSGRNNGQQKRRAVFALKAF
ncbi:hypothetical protein QQS21_012106 [Conoideocrella luteorostrata]|uniref:Peptidase S8/S53 domain-containing protein n=1 Tax=Conoideocrella luteorostrata TaxID=1105319 RepID=A0AAJ0FT11_9HYPO|nr:hypothetical protein QQS21_012106 [Conoideocrella luteorostrata]